MHTAHVSGPNQAPKYIEVPDEPIPASDSDLIQLKVIAVGLHQVVRSRASGRHYSSSGFPLIPGVDGCGAITTGPDTGKLAFFNALKVGHSFQDLLNVPKYDVHVLPDGADPVQIAGLSNPAISSWMAATHRTTNLPKDFTVLILGATSASGRVGVPLMRYLGASRVYGLARNEAAMQNLGYDRMIVLKENPQDTDFGDLTGVDLVLDYLFGDVALATINALPEGHRTQYVHIGAVAGRELTLGHSTIRDKDIVMTGAGLGSWTIPQLTAELPKMLPALLNVPKQDIKVVHLKEVEEAWADRKSRIVFVTDNYQ